jgi:protein ImuA
LKLLRRYGLLYKYTVFVLVIMRSAQSKVSTINSASCGVDGLGAADASDAQDVADLDEKSSAAELDGKSGKADLAARTANKLAGKAAIQAAIAQATIFRIGDAPLHVAAGLPTGFSLLDAQLPGGGWPQGALTEILCDKQGCGEVSLLLPALLSDVEVALKKSSKGAKKALNNTLKMPCLWVSPPYLPYAPGLAQAGLDMQALTIIDAPRTEDALWAGEQALASGAYRRVCVWLRASVADTSLRRLHHAAGVGGAHCWLMRPLQAATQPSPAPLRITLHALADGTMRLHLLKLRGMKPGKTIVLATRYLACLDRDVEEKDVTVKLGVEFNQWLAQTSATTPSLEIRQRALAPDR